MGCVACARSALTIGAAAALLAACGGSQPPISAPGAIPQSHTIARSTTRIPSDLYVIDRWGERVIKFDDHGEKIALRDIDYWKPLDLVTDSHGNVYVLGGRRVGPSQFKYAVLELSHDLRKRLALYSLNSEQSAKLTIDGDDNLYVTAYAEQYGGHYVAEYPYGSTTMSKTYEVKGSVNYLGPNVEGISVNGGSLFIAFGVYGGGQGTYVYTCQIGGSGECVYGEFIDESVFCGFTTTRRFAVYGSPGLLVKSSIDGYKRLGTIPLPPGYFFSYPNCNLHSHGDFVWGGMRSEKRKRSRPAVAVEFDMVHNRISAMVGAHRLHVPVAAYYGNGFVP
jgi:hypothetical protein